MSCNNDVSISYLVCLRLTHEIVCCWLLPIYICEYVIYIMCVHMLPENPHCSCGCYHTVAGFGSPGLVVG